MTAAALTDFYQILYVSSGMTLFELEIFSPRHVVKKLAHECLEERGEEVAARAAKRA